LAASSGKPRSVLIREAIDLLTEHYAWLARGGHGRHAPPYSRRAAREARKPIDPVASARLALELREQRDRLTRRPESEATKARRRESLARLKAQAASSAPSLPVAKSTPAKRAAKTRAKKTRQWALAELEAMRAAKRRT